MFILDDKKLAMAKEQDLLEMEYKLRFNIEPSEEVKVFIKFILEAKFRHITRIATEILDSISTNEGWEESRDFYAKKLNLPLKYTKDE